MSLICYETRISVRFPPDVDFLATVG